MQRIFAHGLFENFCTRHAKYVREFVSARDLGWSLSAVTRRAVFLDRDGVLSRAFVRDGKPYPPKSLDELEVLPQVPEALQALKAEGFDLIMVTNQPDVTRGSIKREVVDAINDRLRIDLLLDEVVTCFHDDGDNCDCRKPKPGMLLRMQKERNIDLSRSFIVGDRWRDIEAGIAAGCKTIFLDHGYSERNPAAQADYVCKTLFQAVAWIKAM
jgi:D-glycero-D-manno-heptose 1,7-bisphosphate phosphatase